MTEYELNKLCKKNSNCGRKCLKCTLFENYMTSQNEELLQENKIKKIYLKLKEYFNGKYNN